MPPPFTLPSPLCRRQDELWRASALQKLPVLMAATEMLVCGEDLGFVPACVPPIMKVRQRGGMCTVSMVKVHLGEGGIH